MLRPQGVVYGVEAGAKIEKRRTTKLPMESLPWDSDLLQQMNNL